MGPYTTKGFYSFIVVSIETLIFTLFIVSSYIYIINLTVRIPPIADVYNHIVTMCLRFRFVVVNAGITYLYFSSFQQIDEEEYGGMWELTKEGFMTSFAGFLVSTTETYFSLKQIFFLFFLGLLYLYFTVVC